MVKCGGCGRFLTAAEAARCEKCLLVYHKACVNIPGKSNVTPNWRCPECKKNVARDNRTETPIRPQNTPAELVDSDKESTDSGSPNGSMENFIDQGRSDTQSRLRTSKAGLQGSSTEFKLLMEEVRGMRSEIKMFRKSMEAEVEFLKSSLVTCNSRIENLEQRVSAIEGKAKNQEATESVDAIVEELRRDLNDRDQELLANDIEISNLPELSGENPIHIVKTIGLKLGVTIDERDIVSVERVGARQVDASQSMGPTERRPRPLVLRVARRETRDLLLRSARVRRGASTADLDIAAPPRRYYLNERLTKTNRQLFRKAREAAGLAGWKFVWTRRGRILACKAPGNNTQWIRSETDISKLFNTA